MPTSASRPAQLKQELLKTVQHRIESVRDKKRISQAQAAEMLGMMRISAIVQGHQDLFSLEALIDVAYKLDLRVRLSVSRPYGSR